MLSTSENLIQNHGYLFPRVEIVETRDVPQFKGMTFNKWEENAILIHDRDKDGNVEKGGLHVGGFCSPKYDLVKNENLFLPIADKLDSLFGAENIDINIKYSKPFEYHLFFEMKGMKTDEIDSLYPMSEAMNSFTTQIKAAQRALIGRLICTNGMMTIAEKAMIFNVKHTVKETGILMDMDSLLMDTEKMFENFGLVIEHRDVMNSVNLSALKTGKNNTEKFESLIAGTNFPKKQIETALNIAQREARQLKQNLTLWLAYNGFNHVLNHDKSTKMTQIEKSKLDGKLINSIHKTALQLS